MTSPIKNVGNKTPLHLGVSIVLHKETKQEIELIKYNICSTIQIKCWPQAKLTVQVFLSLHPPLCITSERQVKQFRKRATQTSQKHENFFLWQEF